MIFSICQNKKHRRSRLRQRRIRERRAMACLLRQPGLSTQHVVDGHLLGELTSPRDVFPRKILVISLLEPLAPAVQHGAPPGIFRPRALVLRQISMTSAVMAACAEGEKIHGFLRSFDRGCCYPLAYESVSGSKRWMSTSHPSVSLCALPHSLSM